MIHHIKEHEHIKLDFRKFKFKQLHNLNLFKNSQGCPTTE